MLLHAIYKPRKVSLLKNCSRPVLRLTKFTCSVTAPGRALVHRTLDRLCVFRAVPYRYRFAYLGGLVWPTDVLIFTLIVPPLLLSSKTSTVTILVRDVVLPSLKHNSCGHTRGFCPRET